MPELVGFQTMVILDPYGITFNAVNAFGPDFQLLFKSGSSYCVYLMNRTIHTKGASGIPPSGNATTHNFIK